MPERIEMVIDGIYVRRHPYWVYKGKNYIAHITGTDPKFKWKREFLKPDRSDGDELFNLKDFMVGGIYEIHSSRTLPDGQKDVAVGGFYRCNHINQVIVFIKVHDTDITPLLDQTLIDHTKMNKLAEELIVLCGGKEEAKKCIDSFHLTKDLQVQL